MKKYLFSFIYILATISILHAQNWQTLTSNKDAFFITQPNLLISNTKQIQAFHSDSIEYLNSDSIFHIFKTMQDTFGGCIIDNRACWLGNKILIRGNGDNVFFNENGDSILIKTLSQLNDTFPIFHYINGDVISAIVTNSYSGIVLGNPDSIKDLTLFVSNSLGNSIANSYNNLSFSISKNNGIISCFNWRDFPFKQDTIISYISNHHRLTYGDIYDYNVGDIFETHGYGIPSTGPGVYINYQVTSKWFSNAMDTVFYEENLIVKDYTFSWLPNPHIDSTITYVTDTIFYTNLSNFLYNGKYPNQVIRDTNLTSFGGLSNYSMNSDSAKFNGRVYVGNVLTNCFWNGTCFEPYFEMVYQTFEYIVGCGSFEMSYYNTTTPTPEGGNIDLIYFKKGAEVFGSSKVLVGLSEVFGNESHFSVYPNPANRTLTVVNLKSNQLSIINMLGKVVLIQSLKDFNSEKVDLDISTLSPGIYFISSGKATIKFVKF